jgi:hypothetical protein
MKAVVDRIEDSIVVLVLSDNSRTILRLPGFLLPGAREGDLVDLLISRDETGTLAAKEQARELIAKLDKNNSR